MWPTFDILGRKFWLNRKPTIGNKALRMNIIKSMKTKFDVSISLFIEESKIINLHWRNFLFEK